MKHRAFKLVFAVLLLIELLVCHFIPESDLRYITKPLIAGSLLLFLGFQREIPIKTKRLLLFGLLFSLTGDALLLFTTKSEHFFLAGLASFLIAHLFFIATFFNKKIFKNIKLVVISAALLIGYALLIFRLIQPNLGNILPYVVGYILVILVLGWTAVLRKGISNRKSYWLFLVGALCFIVSDSILALNKFYSPSRLSNVLIMLTYGAALFFIVMGGLYKDND